MNQEFARAPHRRGDPTAPLHTAALLIDFDNVTMGIRSNLGQELRTLLDSDVIRGKVAVQRAYADWRRYPQYIVPLSESSIDLIFAPAYGSSKKNATDIRLAIDALELVFTRPEIRTFILLSGDSDFSSLVLKLKEYGKYVIGVGLQESTSDILVQNCDEYYSYNRLSGLQSADEITTAKHDPWELAKTAVKRMTDRGDVMRSDRMKQVMLEIDPSFDEKTAGFTKFNRFLAEAAHRNLIRMRKGENGQYEVAAVEGGSSSGSSSASSSGSSSGSSTAESKRDSGSSRRSSGRGRGRRGGRSGRERSDRTERSEAADEPAEEKPDTDAGKAPSGPKPGTLGADIPEVALAEAYRALTEVVEALYDGDSPVRDSMAKRKLLERDSSFDEGALGFRKFSRFLHQADDEGIVNLEQGEDGNYYLTPVEGGKRQPRAERSDRSDTGRSAAPSGSERASSGSGGSSSDRVSSSDPEESREESALARAARRTLGRFRRGSKSVTEEASPRGQAPRVGPVDTPEGPAAEAAPGQEPGGSGSTGQRGGRAEPQQRESRERAGGRAPTSGGSGRGDRSRGEAPKSEGRKSGEGRSEGRGRDAGRRDAGRADESRSRKDRAPDRRPAAASGGAAATESHTAPAAPAAEKADSTRSESAAGAARPAAEAASETRTLGRFRQGSRGRSSTPARSGGSSGPRIGPVPDSELPAHARGNSSEDAESATTLADVSTAPSDRAERPDATGPIDHMVRNYPGVGKRTAEVLVERFGEKVFDVIDQTPEKLAEVLSEGRAQTVIAARRKELEN